MIFWLILLSLPAFSDYKLALNWKPEPQFGGFYQAQKDGLFKEQGLQLEILPGGSGTPTAQMLANGKADFAVVSGEEILILNDKSKRNKVIAVFAVYQTSPQVIMAHKARDFKNLKEVFMSPGILSLQSGLTYAQFLLKKYSQFSVKIVPYSGGIGHFLKDKSFSQQGFLTSEPIAAQRAGAEVDTFLVADEGFNPYTTVIAVRKNFLDKQRPRVEAFVRAVRKGWELYLESPTATNLLMAKMNKSLDQETFRKSAQAQKKLILTSPAFKIGTMTEKRWQELIQQMLDLKIIKNQASTAQTFINL